MSTHNPPQSVKSPLQTHDPPAQCARISHWCEQEPQLNLSTVVFTHVLPQTVSLGSVQAHSPLAQYCVQSHSCAQAPQFRMLLYVSMHDPPQFVNPASLQTHSPPLQCCVSGSHFDPQVPQLCGSFVTSVHASEQQVCSQTCPLQQLPEPPAGVGVMQSPQNPPEPVFRLTQPTPVQ